jgi:hypothetical protein
MRIQYDFTGVRKLLKLGHFSSLSHVSFSDSRKSGDMRNLSLEFVMKKAEQKLDPSICSKLSFCKWNGVLLEFIGRPRGERGLGMCPLK